MLLSPQHAPMRATRENVDEWLKSIDETSLFADGFDSAVIGLSQDGHVGSFRVCYSITRCYEVLIDGGMSEEEAVEYFEYNVLGANMGPTTPIFVI
mgnify:FL=1